MLGKSEPSWMASPGAVLLRKFVRGKFDPLCDQVALIEADPSYAHIRRPDGRESTVFLTDLALRFQTIDKNTNVQRWSPRGRPWPRGRPRGHILKSLALASKVKSLASRPQVLKDWPVLGSRTALFFELLKFCEALEKFFGKRFLWRSLEKFL